MVSGFRAPGSKVQVSELRSQARDARFGRRVDVYAGFMIEVQELGLGRFRV